MNLDFIKTGFDIPFEAFKLQQSLLAHEIYCCFKTTPWDSENLMEIGNCFISRAGQDCL
jgi:hypothetical protein